LEVFRTRLLEWRTRPITGIVDQHVQLSEGIHRYLHGGFCCDFFAHFQRYGLHPLAILRHRRCQFLRPTRSSYDAVACGQRRLGDVSPQTVSASRNQPNLRHCNILLCLR